MVIKALDNYGYKNDALRIAAKYLDIVAKNFSDPKPGFFISKNNEIEKLEQREPGFVYEKYNVYDGTIYDAEYPSQIFHGWSYAVYIWCLDYYRKNSKDHKSK